MSKHTPGPWGIALDKFTGNYRLTSPDKQGVYHWFAEFRTIPDQLGTDVADARLIAAAPELLTAVKELISLNTSYDFAKDNPGIVTNALRAIAKAEGL